MIEKDRSQSKDSVARMEVDGTSISRAVPEQSSSMGIGKQ